nr:hypothetical protein [Tanacetum cinerariifolium]
MSLEESDDLVILDAEPAGLALEAGSPAKFDMHIHKSSLTKIQVKWLIKCYGISEDLHPRVTLEGMTMDALPHNAIWLYSHHFQQGGLRVPTSTVKYQSHVAKLQELVISLRKPPPSLLYVAVISMAEFLRLPNFKGCKVSAGDLLHSIMARVTYLANPAERLEDIPSKTGDMVTAEMPCRKVLDDKEKKKRKAEEKVAANASIANIQVERVVDKDPLETLANEEYVSLAASASHMGALRNQTDEHVTLPYVNVDELVTCGEVTQENADATFADEGHGDNKGGLSSLNTQPRPIHHSVQHPETVKKLVRDKFVPDEEASELLRWRFGNLPFTPQWGLTDSSRMDNSRQCRDMILNLFTPVEHELFNEGVRNDSTIKWSWKLLCQSAQQQANTILRFEALTYKHLEEALKQYEAEAHQLRREKEHDVVKARKGEMVRQKIINQYLPTFVHRLHQSVEYKRSLGEVFSLVVGKGFIDGVSIGRKDACIQAILKATLNVDPASSNTFMGVYEKLLTRGCKVSAGDLLHSIMARVTYLANPAERLEDIPSKTGDMVTAEMPCRKVLDDKEKKKRKAEEKVAANASIANIQVERVVDKDVDNHMGALRNQTDEHVTLPYVNVDELVTCGEVTQENADATFADEGHGDNKGGLSSLNTQPRPIHHSVQHPETVKKLVRDKFVPDEEASELLRWRFGNLPFTPQWGLTDSSRMDNSRQCRDMILNLFTPVEHELFNEGVRNDSTIKWSWKLLCQSAQQQANTILRFEALTYKHLEEALKQYEAEAHQLRREKEHDVVKAGKGEMVRQKIINQYLPTFVHRLHQSVEYKRSLGEVFSLVVGKGFIDGVSIGRKDACIQAILKATLNVDPASSNTFMGVYEKLLTRVASLLSINKSRSNLISSSLPSPSLIIIVWALGNSSTQPFLSLPSWVLIPSMRLLFALLTRWPLPPLILLSDACYMPSMNLPNNIVGLQWTDAPEHRH